MSLDRIEQIDDIDPQILETANALLSTAQLLPEVDYYEKIAPAAITHRAVVWPTASSFGKVKSDKGFWELETTDLCVNAGTASSGHHPDLWRAYAMEEALRIAHITHTVYGKDGVVSKNLPTGTSEGAIQTDVADTASRVLTGTARAPQRNIPRIQPATVLDAIPGEEIYGGCIDPEFKWYTSRLFALTETLKYLINLSEQSLIGTNPNVLVDAYMKSNMSLAIELYQIGRNLPKHAQMGQAELGTFIALYGDIINSRASTRSRE